MKWFLGTGLTVIALWTASVAPDWAPFPRRQTASSLLFVAALVISLVEPGIWHQVGRRVRLYLSIGLLRFAGSTVLFVALFIVVPSELAGYGWVLGTFILLNLALAFTNRILKNRSWADLANLGLSFLSLLLMLVLIEWIAPAATEYVAEAQRQHAVDTARENARNPMAPEDMVGEGNVQPTRSPQWELTTPGGGPEWGLFTGWGTQTDAVMHYWLDGVYDVEVIYNHLGFRGPEIPYEKPDDVYRILIVGDSFIEAREVDYEDTLQAQLGAQLAEARTPTGKRIEVFGVGAVGWGTLQAYLYYHHEGYRFSPDLVIHAFFINDVADNHPLQFYPGRIIDFFVPDEGNTVQLLTESVAPLPAHVRAGIRWLDALPGFLGDSATARLLRRIIDPPREIVPIAGGLQAWHPQNFVFLRLPEIEGYEEAWRRTRRGYEIWAEEARANNAELMVLAIDYPEERVSELAATFFGDDDQAWVWDADLPYTRLADILDPIGVNLILTRERYAEYGRLVGLRPYDALFFVEDGHWNTAGHRVTAELLAETLREKGIVGR